MDQDTCYAEDAQHIDLLDLQQYFRNNSSNLLQTTINERNLIWTYPAGDSHAAERAGWMLRRLGVDSFLHAQKVRLQSRQRVAQEVIIVTMLPAGDQIVCDLKTLDQLVCGRLIDESLKNLQAALGI